MTDFVKTAAFAAKTSLAAKGIKVQHGIALEVVAAFLGYKTYAAFVVEERSEDLKHHLADAEVIVLDYQGGVSRLAELEVLQAFIVQDVIDAIANCRDGVFSDLPEFLDDYVQHELRDVILSDEGVIAAAGTEPFSVELEEGDRSASRFGVLLILGKYLVLAQSMEWMIVLIPTMRILRRRTLSVVLAGSSFPRRGGLASSSSGAAVNLSRVRMH
ncbi:hypothetical protein P5706_34685 [Pseudomonas sp. ChxA]|uniref:hypothetical protein n=1 Tax=Pseudomonas sp. ChxA TaxID=3035473 RepID=UPI002556F7ED|nr:hypothetical protein [Pseudomonas sp. ChxA]MDL2189317.1 hypothetical protein [Pseudomonas sp. ChxA]